MKKNQENVLRYGDIVYITHGKKKEAIIQPNSNDLSCIYAKLIEHDKVMFSFEECLFIITPPSANTVLKEAKAFEEVMKYDDSSKFTKSLKISAIKERLLSETYYNFNNFKKNEGQPIVFDAPIQFLHATTSNYLSFSLENAKNQKENFSIFMKPLPDEYTVFKILPAFEYQKDRDNFILKSEPIRIVANQTFYHKYPTLNLSPSLLTEASLKSKKLLFEIENILFKNEELNFNRNQCEKFEINISLHNDESLWKVNLFSKPNIDLEQISYGQPIWLYCTDHNTTITCSRTLKNKQNEHEVALADEKQLFKYNIMFENLNESISIYNALSEKHNSLWIIENLTYNIGGIIKLNERFRLKHLVSGFFLQISRDEKGGFQFEMTRIREDPATEFMFALPQFAHGSANNTENLEIKKGFHVLIQHNLYGLFLSGEKIDGGVTRVKEKCANFKILCANPNEYEENKFTHTKYIKFLSFLKRLKQLKYLREESGGFHEMSFMVRKMIEKGERFKSTLDNLYQFIMNTYLNYEPNMKVGYINSKRQNLIKNQNIIDVFCYILHFTFTDEELLAIDEKISKEVMECSIAENESLNLSSSPLSKAQKLMINEESKLKTKFFEIRKIIYEKIVELLKKICKNNHENQLHAYKCFPIFQHHINFFPSTLNFMKSIVKSNLDIKNLIGSSIRVNSYYFKPLSVDQVVSLKIFVKDNYESQIQQANDSEHSIQAQINTKRKPINFVAYAISCMVKAKVKKVSLLELLTSICLHNGEPLSINQDILYQIMQANKKIFLKIFYKIELEGKNLYIYNDDGEKINIIELNNENSQSKYFPQFIAKQIECFAAFCAGRNYSWKQYLREIIPIEKLLKFLDGDNIQIDLLAQCYKLLDRLYLDQEPLENVKYPIISKILGNNEKLNNMWKDLTNQNSAMIMKKNDLFIKNSSIPNLVKVLVYDLEHFKNQIHKNGYKFYIKVATEIERGEVGRKSLVKGIKVKKDHLKTQVIEQFLETIKNDFKNKKVEVFLQLFLKLANFGILNKNTYKNREKIVVIYSRAIKIVLSLLGFNKVSPVDLVYLYKYGGNIKEFYNEKDKTTILKNTLSSFASDIKDNLMSMKETVSSMIGKKENDGMVAQVEEQVEKINVEDPKIYSNFIIRNFFLLQNSLDGTLISTEGKAERLIKSMCCKILALLLDMRQDYLLNNFIRWFQEKTLANKKNLNIEKTINDCIEEVLPSILKTGIKRIDNPEDYEESVWDDPLLGQYLNKLEFVSLNDRFQKRDRENYFCDFDEFLKKTQTQFYEENKTEISDVYNFIPCLTHALQFTSDFDLQEQIFEIIFRCYSQREELVENLTKLNLYLLEEETEKYLNTKGLLKELSGVLHYTNLDFSNISDNDTGARKIILQSLDILKKLIIIIKENKLNKDKIKIQNLFSHSNVQAKVITFIKIYFPLVTTLSSEADLETKILCVEILESSYKFLKLFVRENIENKLEVYRNLKEFFIYLEYNVGQISLLCEIYKDNEFLLNSVPDSLAHQFFQLILNEGRQRRFLKFFKIIFCYSNGKDHFNNQLLFINLFHSYFPSDEKDVQFSENFYKIAYSKYNSTFREIQFDIAELQVPNKQIKLSMKLRNHAVSETYEDEPYYYHAELLNLFFICLSGSAMQIMQKRIILIYSLRYFLDILIFEDNIMEHHVQQSEANLDLSKQNSQNNSGSNSHIDKSDQFQSKTFALYSNQNKKKKILDGCTYLKLALIKMTHHLFFKRSGKVKIIHQWKDYFYQFVDFEKKRLKKLNFDIELLPKFNEYMQWTLKIIKKGLVQLQNSDYWEDEFEETGKIGEHNKIYKFSFVLWKKQGYFKNIPKKSKKKIEYIFDTIFKNSPDKLLDAWNKDELEEFQKETVSQPNLTEQQTLLNTEEEENNKIEENEPDSYFLEKNWGILLKELSQNQKTKNLLLEERQYLMLIFRFIHVYFESGIENRTFKGSYMTLPSALMSKIVTFVQQKINKKPDDFKLVNKIIICLTEMVHIAPNPAEIQDFLASNGCITMTLEILSASELQLHNKLKINLIKLLWTLMDGGNLKIQDQIYDFFITVSKSENIFLSFHQVFINQIKNLSAKDRVINHSMLKKSKSNLEYMENILKFLQLCCEGHNLKMQNYLRQQTNSRANYNMLQKVLEIFISLSKDHRSSLTFDNIVQSLDTLTEMVQGPCHENQAQLLNSKFLEIVTIIIEENMTVGGNKKKQVLEEWMAQRLKYKCLNLCISLLEMNADFGTTNKLFRAFSTKILKRNMIDIYNKYTKVYGTSLELIALRNFEEENLLSKKQTLGVKYEECKKIIIESGFLIFQLLLLFAEANLLQKDDKNWDSMIFRIKHSILKKKKILDSVFFNTVSYLYRSNFKKHIQELCKIKKNML